MVLPEILLTAMAVAVIAQPAAPMLELVPRVRLPHSASPCLNMGVPSLEVGYERPLLSLAGPALWGAAVLAAREGWAAGAASKLSGMTSFWPALI
jgi:hypothetical protein